MVILGITGNIATGKSTFTTMLADALAAPVFDADQCARNLLNEDKEVQMEVRRGFGDRIFNKEGLLDRGALRGLVFASAEARKRLENILHPRIKASRLEAVIQHKTIGSSAPFIADIPLLFETNGENEFDLVLVVGCSRAVQMRRLTENRRLHPDLARAIESTQMPLEEKIKRCDLLVWNDGTTELLEEQARIAGKRIQ